MWLQLIPGYCHVYLPTKFSSTEDFPADCPPTTAIWGKSIVFGTPSWVKTSCILFIIGMRASIPALPDILMLFTYNFFLLIIIFVLYQFTWRLITWDSVTGSGHNWVGSILGRSAEASVVVPATSGHWCQLSSDGQVWSHSLLPLRTLGWVDGSRWRLDCVLCSCGCWYDMSQVSLWQHTTTD